MVNNWRKTRRLGGSCLLCDAAATGLLCKDCCSDLPWLTNSCDRCALPLPYNASCPRCLRRPLPCHVRAACRYEYPVPLLVQRLKFHGRPGLGAEFARLMLARIPAHDPSDTCLLPMPLHWRRQLYRGFNQALEIARPLAAHLDIPLRVDVCRRVRATRPQTDLHGRQRRRNVSGAFRVYPTCRLPAHVIVVDDVMTSGHTAAALARSLRRAGVRTVTLWAFARAGIQGIKTK
ncbi:MAG: ComF family protein [Gammaproteobacteria bacterium]|nr:ComF family protein [Gammaproteobacteria bacterium]